MSPVSDDDLAWLLQLLEAEGLVEVEVEEGDWAVRVSRAVAVAPQTPAAAAAPAEIAPAGEELAHDLMPILSPITGTFYESPSPESPAYVEEGSQVERGGVVGLIEAMKVYNEVESPVAGTVVKVLVENKQNVQADQRLMLVRVTGAE